MSLLYRSYKKSHIKSFILIADGFDEYEVVYLLYKFRQVGLSIKSVSLFSKLVYGRQGVVLKADWALAERPFASLTDNVMLILPTGGRNGDALRQDARVHDLLQNMHAHNGRIVVTDSQSLLAHDLDRLLPLTAAYVRPNNQPLEEFVQTLTDRTIYAE